MVPELKSLGYDQLVLSIGNEGVGLPPHKHTAAWLALVVGYKKWSLLPPDALVDEDLYLKTALRPPSKWTSDHVELLRSQAGLLQCVQKPGEVIVVPHSWWHATTNLGDAVGVGAQAQGFDQPPLVPERASVKMNLCSLWLTNRAQKGDLGPGSKAVDLVRRVWQLEPLNVRHILAYAANLVAADLGLWRTLELLTDRASAAERLAAEGLISTRDAQQLVGRLGMWLDNLPGMMQTGERSRPPTEEFVRSYQNVLSSLRAIHTKLGDTTVVVGS
jgi:hypothetical protein